MKANGRRRVPAINASRHLRDRVAAFLARAVPAGAIWLQVPEAARFGGPDIGERTLSGAEPERPDFVLLLPARAFFLCVDSGKGRGAQARQAFHKRVSLLGHRCHLCGSLADVQEALVFEGVKLRARVDG